jgi:hypothetical protein
MVICGIDSGFKGGISILSDDKKPNPVVYNMPIRKTVQIVSGKKKIKQFYDLIEIRKIFQKHLDKDTLFIVEKVAPHIGEGSVSSFSFGRGYGNLEGIIVGLFDKYPIEISSQKWKKNFLDLNNVEIKNKKEEIKQLREDGKTIKEKEGKSENKRQIDKLNRQVKAIAKTLARELASSLYPELANDFKKKNSDGMAESLLIALYGRDKQHELVCNGKEL